MSLKVSIEQLLIVIFVITVTLLNPLIDNSFVQYIDEAFMLFAIVQIILKYSRIKKNKKNYQLFKSTMTCLSILIFVGILSNVNSGLVGFKAVFIDMIGVIKNPIVFIYISCICNERVKERTSKSLLIIARLYISIVFIFGIINLATDIGMSYDIRYGIRTYQFIYRNPAALNEAIFCFLGVIYREIKNKHKLFMYSLLSLISVLLTFRGTALGLIAVFIYLFAVIKKNRPFRLKLTHILGGVGAAFIVGRVQFIQYLIEVTPRSIMLRNSFTIFKEYFPLGSGFATYGSDQAFKNYSQLYTRFGYQKIYWLSEEGGYAANDNFWPMLIGQVGFFGILMYVKLLIQQFRFIVSNVVGKNEKLIQRVLFVLLLISSMGNEIFTSASGMLIYVFIGLLIKSEV